MKNETPIELEPEIQQVHVDFAQSSEQSITSQMEIQQHTEISNNQDVPWSTNVQATVSSEVPSQLSGATGSISVTPVNENQYEPVPTPQTDSISWSKTSSRALPETDVIMSTHSSNPETQQESTISMTRDEIHQAISNGTAVIVETKINPHHQSDVSSR